MAVFIEVAKRMLLLNSNNAQLLHEFMEHKKLFYFRLFSHNLIENSQQKPSINCAKRGKKHRKKNRQTIF